MKNSQHNERNGEIGRENTGEYSVWKQQSVKDRVKDGVSKKMEIIRKQCSIENDTVA